MLHWLKSSDLSRPLLRPLRVACLSLLWLSVLPLLFSMPPAVALLLLGLPGAAGLVSILRRLHAGIRGTLLVVTCLLVISVQAGVGDFRTTFIAVMLAAVLMKGTEIQTTRDGYSIVGFALLGPFVGFVMEMGGVLTTVVAVMVLLGSLTLAGMLAEWQDHLPVQRIQRHAMRVLALALMAIPLAALAFWSIPRLDAPLWGIPTASPSSTGIANTMSPGDIGNLMQDPSTAFRVDFEGRRPPDRLLYWRGLTLSSFDGRTWSEAAPAAPLSPAPVQPSSSAPVTYSISMEPSSQTYFFALDYLVSPAPPGTQQLYDNRISSLSPLRRLVRLERLQSDPHASLQTQSLTPEDLKRYTALPVGFNPRTVAMARSWRQLGMSDEQIVDSALAMYHRDFAYSLRPPLLGRQSVDEFLFQTKVGFCEHFSSSFAVLMRAAGIPTRVVIGYQGGLQNEFGGYWRVRQADAHAWNEVWLDHKGWVRVDPTSALSAQRPPSAGQEDSMLRSIGGNGPLLDWIRQSWGTWFERFDAERQRDLLRMAGLEGVPPVWAGGFSVVLLVVVGWIVVRLFLRERRQRDTEELRAWKRLLKHAERKGFLVYKHEPPLTFSQRLSQQLPSEKAHQLQALTAAFCAWLYAGKADPTLAARLRAFRLPKNPR